MLILAGAILGAVAGYGLTLALALLLLGALGVSQAEGQRATLAGLILAPLGALAGLLAGLWGAWAWTPEAASAALPGVWATLGALGLAALAGACALRARRPLAANRAPPRLLFELRLPADALPVRVTLITPRNTMPADLDAPQSAPDGIVMSGAVDLYFRTRRRHLELRLDGAAPILTRLPLPAAPATGGWSDWRTLTPHISLRWRVQD